MQKSLMVGLTEKDMDAVIHSFDLKPYYHNTLFPVKQNGTLEWKALELQTGMRVAAATRMLLPSSVEFLQA